MARKIQIFELEDGGKAAVEVETAPGEEERIANAREVIVEDTHRKFTDALDAVQKAAAEVLRGFQSKLASNELELSFGLKFSGQVGVVLASTDAEATLNLKAKWVSKAHERLLRVDRLHPPRRVGGGGWYRHRAR